MIILNASDISLSFGVDKILSGVSFAINEGDRVGVVGVNGCGKSTLFKIITGEMQSDTGEVFISKDKTIGILHQNDAFSVNESGDESVLGQMFAAFPRLIEMEKQLDELEKQLAGANEEETL